MSTPTTTAPVIAAPVIGLHRRVSYILGGIPWPDGVVSRRTIRALLPTGGITTSGVNRTTASLKSFLAVCEVRGYAWRGRLFIRVTDPAQLLFNATRDLPDAAIKPECFIHDIDAAISWLAADLALEPNPAVRSMRAAEVEVLKTVRDKAVH
jgi:hypothetical protein